MSKPTDSAAVDQSAPAIDQQILNKAVDWFALLRDGEAEQSTKESWQQWLQQDEQHQEAWEYITAVGQRFSSFQSNKQNKVAASVLHDRQQRRLSRRKVLGCLAGVAGIGLLGWASYSLTPLGTIAVAWRSDQHTTRGEIREISHLTGSRIWLNTNTAINTHKHNNGEQVELIQGELFVDSHGNSKIQVTTAQGQMRPLGTQFSVRKQKQTTLLAVYEGTVEVKTTQAGQVKQVKAGEQVVFSESSFENIQRADLARKAWTRGLLLADDMTLEQIVKELAQYQYGHLSVDPEIAHLRVLGGYPLRDTDKALNMLSNVLPIQIERPLPWWTVIKPTN